METLQNPNHAVSLTTNLRASDRVRQYLEGKLAEEPGLERIKLPPVRDISRNLKVSTATIYHVFKEFTGEGRMHTAAGGGSYLLTAQPKIPSPRAYCVGVAWPVIPAVPRLSYFISHAILQAAMKQRGLNLRPIALEAFETKTHQKVLIDEVDEVDALIFFSKSREFAESEDALVDLYESHKKPVIRLGAPGITHSSNFVALNLFRIASEIGYAWAKCGRQRVAYLVKESINSSTSTLLTLIGFQSGLDRGGYPGSVQVIPSPDIEEQGGYDAMKGTLEGAGGHPDAVLCSGDFLALGAIRALREAGLRVPEDTSVIGGTGLQLSGTLCPGLSRFSIAYQEMGEQVIRMVIERIENGGEARPGVYIPVHLMGGDTTRAAENSYLGIP